MLDVNTSDPLASKSIAASKKNELFIKQYYPLISSCSPKEAWVEYGWKNEAQGFSIYKKRFNEYQLVLNMDLSSLGFKQSNYFDWKLVESSFGNFGITNGMYILRLKNKEVPSVFNVHIYRNDSLYEACEIILRP